MTRLPCTALVLFLFTTLNGQAADWSRFRGPDGSGVAVDSDSLPSTWSPSANLGWKTPLPGPGASSPLIVAGRAFVTCYSGYGLTREDPGDIENLMRHLVCVDLESGELLWQKDVKAALPEDPYSGIGVTAHGYASHTPVSDGENIYTFFGKSGIHAFDLDGNPLWQANVGMESDPARWGSSSSPVVHNDTVIVTASAESQAVIGFDKRTGRELWRQEAEGLDGMWGTPALVAVDGDRTDLVMCVAKEMWGMDPASGMLRWFASATGAGQAYTSVIVNGRRVFAFTGRGGGSIAIDVGGTGDVSDSNTVWTGDETASFASPVRHDSKLYVVSRGILTVVDEQTGDKVHQVRLSGAQQTGGRFGSLDYASPVVVGDRMFYLNGSGQMFVFKLGDKPQQVAINRVTADNETFWGSPAVSNGRMILRSSGHLFCVIDKGETVPEVDAVVASDEDADRAPERGGPSGRRGGGRFDPNSMFASLDTNNDDKLSADELEGNRMADRIKTLDKDGDQKVSKEEFRNGISTLFRRGSRGRGNGYRGRGKDTRPERPQRPDLANN